MSILRSLTGARTVTPIGLDCGECGIRAVQLAHSSDSWILNGLGRFDRREFSKETEPQAQATGPTLGEPLARSLALKALSPTTNDFKVCLSRDSFKGRNVVMAVNGPDVEYLALELPPAVLKSAGADGAGVIHHEIRRLSAACAAKTAVESAYWMLPSTNVSAPNALGAAAASDAVARLLTLADAAGFACLCVDTAATALSRFGTLLNPWSSDKLWGLLDLGLGQTRLVLVVEGIPVLVRAVGRGGASWTERIAQSLRVSSKAAEVLKREHGIAHTQLGSVLGAALRSELNDLAAEVERFYEYVLSCYPGRHAGDLVLVGGGAGLVHLAESLQEVLGISVRGAGSYMESPSCRLRWGKTANLGTPLERFALAVGLAIGDAP